MLNALSSTVVMMRLFSRRSVERDRKTSASLERLGCKTLK